MAYKRTGLTLKQEEYNALLAKLNKMGYSCLSEFVRVGILEGKLNLDSKPNDPIDSNDGLVQGQHDSNSPNNPGSNPSDSEPSLTPEGQPIQAQPTGDPKELGNVEVSTASPESLFPFEDRKTLECPACHEWLWIKMKIAIEAGSPNVRITGEALPKLAKFAQSY